MKKIFSRKFFAALGGLGCLGAIFYLTLKGRPEALNASVLIAYGAYVITLVLMYVGGNVWSDWIRSKYFHPELKE